jgi:hypothetical protein
MLIFYSGLSSNFIAICICLFYSILYCLCPWSWAKIDHCLILFPRFSWQQYPFFYDLKFYMKHYCVLLRQVYFCFEKFLVNSISLYFLDYLTIFLFFFYYCFALFFCETSFVEVYSIKFCLFFRLSLTLN